MTPEQQWLEIYVRMVAGEPSEKPFEGVLEVRAEDSDELRSYRVQKDRHRWRVETADGWPVSIRNDRYVYSFHDEDPDHPGRSDAFELPLEEREALVARPHPQDWRWSGDDFTRPAEMPQQTSYLGREAWQVTLLPPPHKESPLVVTVDARTGMLLQERSLAVGVLRQWSAIRSVDDLDDETFTWHGGFVFAYSHGDDEEHPEELRAEVLAEQARARAFRQRLQLEVVSAPVELELEDPYVDEDGSVSGWFRVPSHVRFARAHTSDEPDDGELQETWRTPAGWTWTVAVGEGGPDLLQAVRDALEPRSIVVDEI